MDSLSIRQRTDYNIELNMSTTDKKTATCLLNEYLKKTYGEDVLEYIGYKRDIGKNRLSALIENSLPKKNLLSDEDVDIARIRIERHLNEKSGLPLTNPTGKKSETYPWQKGRGVCDIPPEYHIEKKSTEKQKPIEEPKQIENIPRISIYSYSAYNNEYTYSR